MNHKVYSRLKGFFLYDFFSYGVVDDGIGYGYGTPSGNGYRPNHSLLFGYDFGDGNKFGYGKEESEFLMFEEK